MSEDKSCQKMPRTNIEDDIVISGIAGRFPSSDNVQQLQENLMNKVDLVSSEPRWKLNHPKVPKLAGKVNGIEKFDALFFGVPARQAHAMDPVSRMLLEHTYEAIVDAGVNPRRIRGSNTGVFIAGHISEAQRHWLYDKNPSDGGVGITGCSHAMLANRISYWLGIHGPSYSIDTACSSSLFALEHAYRSIRDGLCDAAIVGGGHMCLNPHLSMHFFELGVLSKDCRCKTFDESANGYVRTEAVSVVYLQKAKDAKRIYATVVHAKTNCDGFKDEGITFPSRHMQNVLLKEFYQECGVSPELVEYVEAHGTGTKIGDLEEMNTIDSVFSPGRTAKLKIGSVKSNLGHSESASAMSSIAKAIIAMEARVIPPNLHFKQPRKGAECLEDGRLTVVTEPTSWEGGYIAINSFGFGGANAHVLLKSHTKEKINNGAASDDLPRLVAVSGRTEDAVSTIIESLKQKPVDIEYIKLLHDIHSEHIHGHLYRGFTLLSPRAMDCQPISEIQLCQSVKRPVWFVFSGVGSQWPGMGESLLQLPIFANAMKKCDVALKPYGIDIFRMITDKDEKALENPMNLVVGIAAIQIGLVDVLRSIGIVPDNIIGHSIGELASAYADGCLTAEQTIVIACLRVKALFEATLIPGSMASIGLSHEELKKVCPSDIDAACCNTSDNTTISGPVKSIKNFLNTMQKKKIFAKEVACGGIPYHSRYIASVGPQLLKYLQEIIPDSKKRSPKWLSTSILMKDWDSPSARLSSPEYYVNNLIGAVYFDQVLSLIPKNAITIEIAPHSLFNAILRRSVDPSVTNIALTKRDCSDGVSVLLQGIGKMFTAGLQPQLANLYPSVKFPVSRSTPMISPLIKWDHSNDWFVNFYKNEQSNTSGGRVIKFSLADERYKSMADYIVDGKNLFPYTAYLTLVWETFAITCEKLFSEISVTFKDVRFIKSIEIPKNGSIDFLVNIQKDTGKFDVIAHEETLATGYIHMNNNSNIEMSKSSKILNEKDLLIPSDVYKELRFRGYEHSGLYKSIQNASIAGSHGHIIWQNDWPSFIDNMLQYYFLGIDTRNLLVPTVIKKLVINTEIHREEVKKSCQSEGLPVYVDKCLNYIVCSGVEINGLNFSSIVRKKCNDVPLLEKYEFNSYLDKANTNIHEILRCVMQIVSENHLYNIVKIIEISKEDNYLWNNLLIQGLSKAVDEMILVQADLNIIDMKSATRDNSLPSNVIVLNPKQVNSKTNAFLAVGHQLLKKSKDDHLNLLLLGLKNNGFLLTCEDIKESDDDIYESAKNKQLDIILDKKYENTRFILLRKRIIIPEKISVVYINNEDFHWLEDMKKSMQQSLIKEAEKSTRIIFVGQNSFDNGLLGFVNCLRKEPGGEVVRGFLIQDPNAPKFSLQNPFYYNQVQKDLAVNVLRENETWGCYRYQLLPSMKSKLVQKAKIDQLTRGDLSSLAWFEDPTQIQAEKSNLIDVYYSSVNLKDVMLATGKLAVESIINSRMSQEFIFGIEYSGINALNERKMGIIANGSLATTCIADPVLTWTIPNNWSLEDGATVPLAYSVACYVLYNKGHIKKSDKVLIHEGDSAVGQAAINLALHEGCEIFTTVDSANKFNFVHIQFPQIPKSHISYSQDSIFEKMVKTHTKGVGVDIVLNCSSKINLQDSIDCLAKDGRFLHIDNYNLISNDNLEINRFSREINFQIISQDQVTTCATTKLEIQRLISDGLKNGSIKPIARTIYSKENLKEAFHCVATSSTNTRKVLLQIRDEKKPNTSILALPRYQCLENRSYIILGGLGGFGLELADWMVLRGAKHLIITSRFGLRNAYQKMRVKLWQSYGVQVVILTGKENLTRDDCQSILETAEKIAPVDSLFNLNLVLRDAEWLHQTKESFEDLFRIKTWATRYFDELTRTFCPELKNFVIFSSFTSRGNPGQTNYAMSNTAMGQICEKRAAEGLPALAVQWGPVGDAGIVVNTFGKYENVEIIGSTQQPMSSCFREFENLLLQKRPVVSCLVLAKKTATHIAAENILETILRIMEIKDLQGVSLNTPLAELGLDSMMTMDIVHTLEKKFALVLTTQDVRSLNFAKLQEIYNSNM